MYSRNDLKAPFPDDLWLTPDITDSLLSAVDLYCDPIIDYNYDIASIFDDIAPIDPNTVFLPQQLHCEESKNSQVSCDPQESGNSNNTEYLSTSEIYTPANDHCYSSQIPKTSGNVPQKSSSNGPQKSSSNGPQKSSSNGPQKSSSNGPRKSSSNGPRKSSSNGPRKSSSNVQRKTLSNVQRKTLSNVPRKSSSNVPWKSSGDVDITTPYVTPPVLNVAKHQRTTKRKSQWDVQQESVPVKRRGVLGEHETASVKAKLAQTKRQQQNGKCVGRTRRCRPANSVETTPGSSRSNSDNEEPEKRCVHNIMERIRRKQQGLALQSLREQIPHLKNDVKAPKVKILEMGTHFINLLKIASDELTEDKKRLLDYNRALKKKLELLTNKLL